jgi:F-type H+-transporting ATPase subunit a
MSLLYNGLAKLSEKIIPNIPFLTAAIPLPANFFFDIFEGILQSFIFTMLTMVFIANGITKHEKH